MPVFVVQKHKSSTLHYDFRLEIGNVLKSWAVPKGPTLDPSLKRLAVETADHDMSYRYFEGVIPAGEYGAGEVIVWDSGEYETASDVMEQYLSGNIEFTLKGKKLKGLFRLVKTVWKGKNANWLLIKAHDIHISGDDILAVHPGSVLSIRRI